MLDFLEAMKTKPLIEFLLLIFLSSPITGLAAPPVARSSLLAALTNSQKPVSPPNPASLAPDWLRFFDVDSPELGERISRTIETLDKLRTENAAAAITEEINRITENLKRYRELRDEPLPEANAPADIQDSYSLQQWLDLVHKQQNLQADLQSEKEELLGDDKRLNSEQQRLDTKMAAYLALSEQAPDKVYQGLQIISAGIELALDGEKSRLKKGMLVVNQTQMTQLNRQIKAARSRIAVSEPALQLKREDIKEAEQNLKSIRKKLTQLLAEVPIGNQDTEKDKARLLLAKQKINFTSIQEAVAEVALARTRMEYFFLQMLATEDSRQLNHFRSELEKHLDGIGEIGDHLEAWRDKAENDQERAGKFLAASLANAAEPNSAVVKLARERLTEIQNTLLSLQRLDSEVHDAQLIAELATALSQHKVGALMTGLVNVKSTSAEALQSLWEYLETSLFTIGETPVTLLGLLRVVVVITLAWILSHFVRRGLAHLAEYQRGSTIYLYTLGRLVHYLILIIGISIGLSSIGMDLTNFALIAGALSVGIGFGLQAIINNFVSGLIVLFERSLRIGDFVELSSGLAGEVKAINVRSTLITTTDMVDILVPNSEFVSGQVINWTLTDASRRIHIPFGVAYGSDKDLVRKAALEAAHNTPHTLKNHSYREPEVWLTNFGGSSLDFELVVWVLPHAVKKPQKVRAAYYWELETALRKYGITIPFPQIDLHIRE